MLEFGQALGKPTEEAWVVGSVRRALTAVAPSSALRARFRSAGL